MGTQSRSEGAKGTEEDPKASSADLKAPEESGLTDAKQEEKEASEEKAAAAAAASTGKEPESANLKEVAEELSRLAQTVEGGLEIIQEKEAVVQKVSSRIAGDNTSGDATPSDDDNVTPGPSAATFPAASFTTIALAIVSGGAALLVAN